MDKTLLRLLSDGRFHSGSELGLSLGVGRGAVWKQLRRLEAELGVQLHKVPGRGYRLAQPISLLDVDQLDHALEPLGWALQAHDSVDSTNTCCLRAVQQRDPLPLLVVAEEQTHGRGRRGRSWQSAAFEDVCFSVVFRVETASRQLAGLSLVVGLAVRQALKTLGLPEAGLKWPNDVLVGERKLAGILLELSGDPSDVCHVVIGVGINVNATAAKAVDQPWTSMRMELGRLVDRTEVLVAVVTSLHHYLMRHASVGFKGLRDEWEAAHLWQGRTCHLSAASQSVLGRVKGVELDGALRLEVDGEDRLYSAGELSLRLADDS